MFSNKKRNMEYIDVSSLPANFIGGHRTRMRFFVRFDSRRDPLSRAVLSLSFSAWLFAIFSQYLSLIFLTLFLHLDGQRAARLLQSLVRLRQPSRRDNRRVYAEFISRRWKPTGRKRTYLGAVPARYTRKLAGRKTATKERPPSAKTHTRRSGTPGP